MNLRLLTLLLVVLTFSACATKQQKAVRHLNKAIELDSTVLKNVVAPVVIDTTIVVENVVVIDTTIIIPEKTVESSVSNKEFKGIMDSLEASEEKITFLENELVKVSLQRTKDGLVDINTVIKQVSQRYRDTLTVIDTIPFYLETEAPTVAPVTERIEIKGYFHRVGVAIHYILGLLIIIGIIYYVFYKRNSRA